jgi:hypothetical protein
MSVRVLCSFPASPPVRLNQSNRSGRSVSFSSWSVTAPRLDGEPDADGVEADHRPPALADPLPLLARNTSTPRSS